MRNIAVSKSDIKQLKKLNTQFKNEERRIKKFADELWFLLHKQKENKLIDDFNFEPSFSVFSSKKSCNTKFNVEKGDSFYKCSSYLLFGKDLDISFYKDDWKEGIHSSLDFDFCYTMHCLIYHSNLDLKDILSLDDVWIELNVTYQFFIEK